MTTAVSSSPGHSRPSCASLAWTPAPPSSVPPKATAASSASGATSKNSFSGSTPSPTSRTSTRPSSNSVISTTTSGSSNATTTGLPHWSVGTSLAPEPPREYTQPTVQEIPGGSQFTLPDTMGSRFWVLVGWKEKQISHR